MSNKVVELRLNLIKEFVEAKDERVLCQLLKDHSTYIVKGHPNIPCDYQSFYVDVSELNNSEFTVFVSKDKGFKDYFVIKSQEKHINLKVLQGGETYYYRVYGDNDFNKVLKEGVIKTKNVPGIFYNINQICNTRDIGGWKTSDGRTIKHGLIIRSIRTNDHDNVPLLNEEARKLLSDSLKIKGEIDLRHSGDNFGQTHNIFNENYPYLSAPIISCCYILPFFNEGGPNNRFFDEKSPKSICNIIKFLLNKDNYPVLIHCNSGADRTGTICMLIEGLLGVKEEDIYKDFELSSFSPATLRWRSAINDDLTFDESGVMQDDEYNYVAAQKCIRLIKEHYGQGLSLEKAIHNYLKVVCGITDSEINKLKEMLLK